MAKITKSGKKIKEVTNSTYIVTDCCMWEMNKKNGTYYPHAIEVVDMETGQVRYIRSGSQIKFIEGDITESRDQKSYNELIINN